MNLRQPLWLILVLPSIGWFVLSLWKGPSIRLSPLKRLAEAGKSWRVRLWWLPEAALTLFFCLGALLLAGPERDLSPPGGSQDGLAVTIAMDRSGSMGVTVSYQGEETTRLDAVKAVTRDFLSRREEDRFALITFARYPETNSPLTGNKEIIDSFLDLIQTPTTADEDGTAIGDALVLASARLTQNGAKRGVVILLTDGQNNRGAKSPEEGAAIAHEAGITVYCIALGGAGYVVQDTAFGKVRQKVDADVDEGTLETIAAKTGGAYYRADGVGDLKAFYDDIAARETERLQKDRPNASELNLELGLWVLIALLGLSLITRYTLLRRMDP